MGSTLTEKKVSFDLDDSDIETIANNAVKSIAKELREAAIKDANAEVDSIWMEAEELKKSDLLDEAYVAQKKTYAMTTSYVSEPAKKHHEQLYTGYTEMLGRVSAEVDAADKVNVSAAHSPYRHAKKDEVYNLNATYLHELFFANCFDPNSELFQDAIAFMHLARDWGTFDAWMADFMACALASRGGWVVCGYSLYLKQYINVCVDSHDQGVLVGLVPVLVIDMWEHAYVRDYAADKKSYLTAMMREIDWEVVEDRVERVDALKGVMG